MFQVVSIPDLEWYVSIINGLVIASLASTNTVLTYRLLAADGLLGEIFKFLTEKFGIFSRILVETPNFWRKNDFFEGKSEKKVGWGCRLQTTEPV